VLPPEGGPPWPDPIAAGVPALEELVDWGAAEGVWVVGKCRDGAGVDGFGKLTVGVVTGSRGTVTAGTVTVGTVGVLRLGVVTEGVERVGVVTTGVDTVGTVSDGAETEGRVSALLGWGCQPSSATHSAASPSAQSRRDTPAGHARLRRPTRG